MGAFKPCRYVSALGAKSSDLLLIRVANNSGCIEKMSCEQKRNESITEEILEQ